MVQLIEEEGMSMTPYSPLAAGRVCRMWDDNNTERGQKDLFVKKLYEPGKENDMPIVQRIKELADKLKITMAQVSLAWILSKKCVAIPVIGCTKIKQLEDLVEGAKVKLSEEDIKYLEELYKPHKLLGPLSKEDCLNMAKRLNEEKK